MTNTYFNQFLYNIINKLRDTNKMDTNKMDTNKMDTNLMETLLGIKYMAQ